MSSPAIAAKARNYLAEGRINVQQINGDSAVFKVKGSLRVPYTVRLVNGRWQCNCPARVTCCHVEACALIVPSRDTAAVSLAGTP